MIRYYFLSLVILLSVAALNGRAVHAADAPCDPKDGYCLLAPLPIGDSTVLDRVALSDNIKNYIPAVVKLVISVAGGLAVIRIIIGGVQYMSSDAWFKKNDAKKTIQNAIFGLLLAIGSYVILNTLNPSLVNFNLSIETIKQTTIDTTGAVSTSLSAEDLGCTNCEPIDTSVISVSPSACYNKPCYIKEDILSGLENLQNLKNNSADDSHTHLVIWQVTKAFPQATSSATDVCYRPSGSGYTAKSFAGGCTIVSLANPSTDNVVAFINALQKEFDEQFVIYNACPASRMTSLQNNTSIDKVAQNKIRCNTGTPEQAKIEKRS